MDWFLYGRDLRHERVSQTFSNGLVLFSNEGKLMHIKKVGTCFMPTSIVYFGGQSKFCIGGSWNLCMLINFK